MWDLTVSNVHTFAVGAAQFVVHNCTPGDQLPIRLSGDKTRGVFVANDGTETNLISGRGGPAERMPPKTPGMQSNMQIRTHVEAHAAALMREGGIQDATLYINNTPCSGVLGCHQMLPHMLPEDASLTVYFKDELNGVDDWVIRKYTGLPDSNWKWPPF
jgi:nucleic acid/nucleotide deaminase of polymorphic system toxin